MLPNGKITYSHDVIFDEDKFPPPPSELAIVPSSMADEDYFLKATSYNSNNLVPSVVNEEATVHQSSLQISWKENAGEQKSQLAIIYQKIPNHGTMQ
ncbi:hypothetical protein O181_059168 [Austropuccinia psidii MF-1]|uniref:Uncharacterized protein n=1 Tax=Austropuccinia psidii MF-1 TaxID=1389203 RepID=A0A9Q3EEC9_9BASI|nr:hypothetical protein [Austropuccinia psidii MF-1]